MNDLGLHLAGVALMSGGYGAIETGANPLILSAEPLVVCHEQGCRESTSVELTTVEAGSIAGAFGPLAASAQQERAAIARAIGRFEQIVGPRTGTERDLGGTFPGAFRVGQMDCIDESTNTTLYLHRLAQAGYLRHHAILAPVTRLPIPRGWWPHTTAVIRDHSSGRRYAVDSWFDANGDPAHIIELETWRRGWRPGNDRPAP